MRSPTATRSRPWALLAMLALGTACDVYERPNTSVPPHFQSTMMSDGSRLDASALEGSPTVLALWVPR